MVALERFQRTSFPRAAPGAPVALCDTGVTPVPRALFTPGPGARSLPPSQGEENEPLRVKS